MNDLKLINEMLHIIENDQSNEQLKEETFYNKLLELFVKWMNSIDNKSFEYYEHYEKIIEYEGFLAHYCGIFFEKGICPDDDLTGIWDHVNRFVRHNEPPYKYHIPSLYEISNSSIRSIKNKPKESICYIWQNNPDKELPELCRLMIDKYKLIAPETTYEQFKAIFTGQPIQSIEPIKWHQENASELLYFFDRLEQLDNIVHNPKKADYQK